MPETISPGGSNRTTNDVIFSILEGLMQGTSRMLDFGAGTGHMSQRVGELMIKKGMDPARYLHACEIAPEKFQYGKVECRAISTDSRIPFEDNSFDIIYSIEVLEHTPRPYDFFEEAGRKLKKGGRLIFSVPNTLQMQSRLKFLFTGFGEMYPPPSIHMKNAGRICGHIMPLNYSQFSYALRKAGFSSIAFHSDRKKKSAVFPALLLYPFLKLGTLQYGRSLKRYDLEVWEETRDVVRTMNTFSMLTSRSCIIVASK